MYKLNMNNAVLLKIFVDIAAKSSEIWYVMICIFCLQSIQFFVLNCCNFFRPYQCSYFKYFSMHINIHIWEKRIIITLLYNFIISYANGVTFFSSISHNFDSFLNLIQKKRWTNDNIGTIYIYLHCVFVVKWHLVLLKQKPKQKQDFHTWLKRQRIGEKNQHQKKSSHCMSLNAMCLFIGLGTLFSVPMAFIVINIDTHVDIFSFWCRSPGID